MRAVINAGWSYESRFNTHSDTGSDEFESYIYDFIGSLTFLLPVSEIFPRFPKKKFFLVIFMAISMAYRSFRARD